MMAGASLRILRESVRLAVGSLRSNKLRTFLTTLGIIVGVTAVIAVMTIIGGLDATVANTFSSQGSTVFTVTKRPMMVRSRSEAVKYAYRRDITKQDAEAIARACGSCATVGVSSNHGSTVKFGDKMSEAVRTRGLTAEMFEIEGLDLSSGRPWNVNEESASPNYAVVGADIVDNLFGDRSPGSVIGEEIRIDGRVYLITGVAASQGKLLGFSRDNFVAIPFTTAQRIYGSRSSLTVSVRVGSAADFDNAVDEVRAILRSRRSVPFGDPEDGFSIESQDAFVELYREATSGIYLATIGIAAISLVVGGIVVMNIMLVTVTERSHEIGLRKSVGARQKDIIAQFMVEAVAVTVSGGAIGVGAGYATAFLLARTMGFPLAIEPSSAVLGVTVSAIVGVASGVYPAWKASRLNPIEAMRRER
jgi:putative ABC transport system permease protein